MSTKNYTTKTAALKATTIDTRLVDVSNNINVALTTDEDGNITGGTQINKNGIVTSALSIEMDGEQKDIATIIQENAGIGIGTQSEPFDDETPDTGFATGVQKINFKGKYVNVIRTEKDNEVTLWIQPNESVADFSKVSTPSTTNYILYNTDDYTLPVAAGSQTAVAQVKNEGTAFDNITLTAQTAAGSSPVTISSKDYSIWWRVNGGTTLGQFPILDSSTNKGKTGTVTSNNVSCNVTANTVWTNDDAENGKVPGQAEVAFNFAIATASLAANGGSIRLEYVIQKDTPTVDTEWTVINLFVSKYNDPSIATATATLNTSSVKTIQVSGINYLTSGNIYNVSATGIANTQHKINRTTNRVRLSGAGGTAKNYANGNAALTRTDSDKADTYSSDAVYSLSDTYTVGSTGTPGTTQTLSMHAAKYSDTGNPTGVAKVINLENTYWGASRVASSDAYELFQQETYRVKDDNTAWTSASFNATTDAVVLAGKLYHVAGTAYKKGYSGGTSGSGRWTSTAAQCTFSRVFKNTSSDTCASVTISAANTSNGTALTTDAISSLVRAGKVDILLRGIASDGSLEAATWNCGKYSSETGTSSVVGILKEISNNKLVCTIAGLAFPKNKGCLIQVVVKDTTVAVPPFRVDLV